jgi:hypothetical protein
MMKIKKINIWESEGFWVIDMIEEGEDSETVKVCTTTLPEVWLAPQYYHAKKVELPKMPKSQSDGANSTNKSKEMSKIE